MAALRETAVRMTRAFEKPVRRTGAGAMREPDAPGPRMFHEATDKNQTAEVERCLGARPFGFEKKPHQSPCDLRGEGFAQQPDVLQIARQESICHIARVILKRPASAARVGKLNQPGAAAQRLTKRPEQRPVAVQPGEINQRRLAVAVNTAWKAVGHEKRLSPALLDFREAGRAFDWKWCAREDLNLHPLRDQILSLARLPFRHSRDADASEDATTLTNLKPGLVLRH